MLGTFALTSAVALALTSLGSAADAASSVNYVALGDSYSSGVGTGSESGSCQQSSQAYGPLWAAANAPASFTFAACTGAKIPDVESSQLSALSASTTLVSITIGGNDVGFSTIMETCVLDSDSSCESAINAGVSAAQNTLPAQFATLYSDIRAAAPNAKVVYLDYPLFYDTSVSGCIGLDSTKHTALNNGINTIDNDFKAAATAGGATFADVRSAFAGHELCDSSAWLHSVNVLDINQSYHPNASGHQYGYLPAFSTAAASVGQ
jgi:lysophospholipase L1-like esterase